MPREFHRSRRIEDQIQRILSEILRTQVRDPRLENVVITGVDVSRDLSVAWVHFNTLGREADARAAFDKADAIMR